MEIENERYWFRINQQWACYLQLTVGLRSAGLGDLPCGRTLHKKTRSLFNSQQPFTARAGEVQLNESAGVLVAEEGRSIGSLNFVVHVY